MKKRKFSFEDLEVWQKAVDFAKMVINLTEKINTSRRHYRLIEQLEASSTSISLYCAWFFIRNRYLTNNISRK